MLSRRTTSPSDASTISDEQAGQLQCPLALGEVEHAPGKLEVDVDQRSPRALMNILERSWFCPAGRCHQHEKAVVKLGRLVDLS